MPSAVERLTALARIEALMAGYELPDLADLLDRPAWHADALCREYPDVDFFPGKGQPAGPARAVCARCAVASECRAYALAHDDAAAVAGVWGGTTQRERATLRRPVAA